MEIREFKNGSFQVWNGTKVLRPFSLTWENNYQSQHNFMFFNSMDEAEQAIKDVSAKEKIAKIHKVSP